jgi:hypothetical protein
MEDQYPFLDMAIVQHQKKTIVMLQKDNPLTLFGCDEWHSHPQISQKN